MAPHGDEAEVLRGGLLLSYGVHDEAGQIFAALIHKGAAPSVRDRAWFYLGKIRYQRGLHAQAEEALAHIEGRLPPPLAEEHDLLRAQLLMARGDFAGAANLLGAMTGEAKQANPFARFNLGVALVKGGEVARGKALLDEIGRTPADNEEQRSLRDRANLALGVAALQEQRPDDARRLLERVRLNGLHANKALLGFGWVAEARKQPAQALAAWNELASRDGSDPAVLEARIAVPLAYTEMGAYGQSLQFYEQAVTEFDNEGLRLDASIASIRSGRMIDALLERNPAEEMGWFGDPEQAARHAARRTPVPGTGRARVPGGLQERARPALSRSQLAAMARYAGRVPRHAGQSAPGLQRTPAASPGPIEREQPGRTLGARCTPGGRVDDRRVRIGCNGLCRPDRARHADASGCGAGHPRAVWRRARTGSRTRAGPAVPRAC